MTAAAYAFSVFSVVPADAAARAFIATYPKRTAEGGVAYCNNTISGEPARRGTANDVFGVLTPC